MKTIFLMAVLMMGADAAQARLGETEDEILARFGNPVLNREPSKPASKSWFCRKGQMVISIEFLNGKSCAEGYFKFDKSALSDTEIEALLTANSSGKPWKKLEIISVDQTWEREDGLAFANYDSFDHFLFIATREFHEGAKAAREAKEKAKLKDF